MESRFKALLEEYGCSVNRVYERSVELRLPAVRAQLYLLANPKSPKPKIDLPTLGAAMIALGDIVGEEFTFDDFLVMVEDSKT